MLNPIVISVVNGPTTGDSVVLTFSPIGSGVGNPQATNLEPVSVTTTATSATTSNTIFAAAIASAVNGSAALTGCGLTASNPMTGGFIAISRTAPYGNSVTVATTSASGTWTVSF